MKIFMKMKEIKEEIKNDCADVLDHNEISNHKCGKQKRF